MNINQIEEKRNLPKSIFKGVGSTEALPTGVNSYPYCFVRNTDCNCLPGEHWVAFYFDKYGHGHYFDSFGRKPPHELWIKYLEDKSMLGIKYFNHQVQPYDTQTCGYFCIYYLLHRYYLDPIKYSDYSIMSDVSNSDVVHFVNSLSK